MPGKIAARPSRIQLKADATPVIDKATFGGNAFNDFLGGQYRRHTAISRRSLS
jgi:hypothetical protein